MNEWQRICIVHSKKHSSVSLDLLQVNCLNKIQHILQPRKLLRNIVWLYYYQKPFRITTNKVKFDNDFVTTNLSQQYMNYELQQYILWLSPHMYKHFSSHFAYSFWLEISQVPFQCSVADLSTKKLWIYHCDYFVKLIWEICSRLLMSLICSLEIKPVQSVVLLWTDSVIDQCQHKGIINYSNSLHKVFSTLFITCCHCIWWQQQSYSPCNILNLDASLRRLDDRRRRCQSQSTHAVLS